MKRVHILLIIVLLLISCHSAKYTHTGNVNSSLDLTEGKWLLNEIIAPPKIKYSLTEIAAKEFTELLGSRFSVINTISGVLVPNEISNNPSKDVLKDIRIGTGYDFLINISAKNIENEVQILEIGSRDIPGENKGEVIVDIYDLKLLEKVYSHSVIGRVYATKNSQDLVFAKTTEMLINKSLERIVKKIKKNQIKTN